MAPSSQTEELKPTTEQVRHAREFALDAIAQCEKLGVLMTERRAAPIKVTWLDILALIDAELNRRNVAAEKADAGEKRDEMSPRVARLILQARDALYVDDYAEAYHNLYAIASPKFDKQHADVWTDVDRIATQPEPAATGAAPQPDHIDRGTMKYETLVAAGYPKGAAVCGTCGGDKYVKRGDFIEHWREPCPDCPAVPERAGGEVAEVLREADKVLEDWIGLLLANGLRHSVIDGEVVRQKIAALSAPAAVAKAFEGEAEKPAAGENDADHGSGCAVYDVTRPELGECSCGFDSDEGNAPLIRDLARALRRCERGEDGTAIYRAIELLRAPASPEARRMTERQRLALETAESTLREGEACLDERSAAEIRSLLSPPPYEGSEAGRWQPIETAPKDGSDVLVTYKQCDSWFVHNAFWMDGEGVEPEDIGWWSYLLTEVSRTKLDECCEPTHWRPTLPPPYQPDATAQGKDAT
jgi:hypothetical protein